MKNGNVSKTFFPPERPGKRGRPANSNRDMLNGMLWIARSGAQWRELPFRYGPVAVCVFEIRQMEG
ncbi:MAG TPA: hypothetical protein DIW07_06260 [Lachnospiraceae bacterium]|nr:hypothetical protein [Lachnospiraceae bacterium]